MNDSQQHLAEAPLESLADVVLARQKVRGLALRLGLQVADQTRLVTATAGLGRRLVVTGAAGTLRVFRCFGAQSGLRLVYSGYPGTADALAQLVHEPVEPGLPGVAQLADRIEVSGCPGTAGSLTLYFWL
ncbi:anti-sigma regulatory factor [Geomonas limicola]|uniref:Anti-sigma regulatory factor n=1 Tax=Geomonas limicola TaxID=2740186 RepID=A0A6V8N9Q0_9BACT|nr:hypothetical protein [Geomonas limicola]GFO69302.1 anti-sigma regulatory factor [Geomonas limicola]